MNDSMNLSCFRYLDRIKGWLGTRSSIWVLWLLVLTVWWENWCKLTGLIRKELGVEGKRQL